METKLLAERSGRHGCQSGGGCTVVVHAVLIQSKSIKVKSQVPIQVLLEKGELNRNDHLGKRSPLDITSPYYSSVPVIGPTRTP